MVDSLADLAAAHAGITSEQARRAVTSALRSLHRTARIDQKGLTAVALEAYFNFGTEACYHLFSLIDEQRLQGEDELPWSETLVRLDPSIYTYRALVDHWIAGEGDPEPIA